jgi:hypothetical protein
MKMSVAKKLASWYYNYQRKDIPSIWNEIKTRGWTYIILIHRWTFNLIKINVLLRRSFTISFRIYDRQSQQKNWLILTQSHIYCFQLFRSWSYHFLYSKNRQFVFLPITYCFRVKILKSIWSSNFQSSFRIIYWFIFWKVSI